MVGLLLLKQQENLNAESVVEHWVRDPSCQYFCGMMQFQWETLCDPSDLVHFRKRIGEQGVALILSVSARMYGDTNKIYSLHGPWCIAWPRAKNTRTMNLTARPRWQ